VHH
jgi:uncharacterized membrane protein YfcA